MIGHDAVVRVSGEIDLATVEPLRDYLNAAIDVVVPPGRVIVDLNGVEFFSSAGIGELVTARNACIEQATPLILVAEQPVVLRPMETTGLARMFDIRSSGGAIPEQAL
ncbi:anti-sigma factor antagonist [Pseudonocardiaceae bacterium YIM PH 21723]|nr:anti-sigma factor antagonist [Pseudonocardiaceae bacterium YIM PH 21723]